MRGNTGRAQRSPLKRQIKAAVWVYPNIQHLISKAGDFSLQLHRCGSRATVGVAGGKVPAAPRVGRHMAMALVQLFDDHGHSKVAGRN